MARLRWWFGCLLAAACGEEPAAPAPPAAPLPPPTTPVILVSLDTCRSDRLAPYGGVPEASPMLQRLAAEAVTFTDCLTQSTNTGPSHRSLFTGQFVHRHAHRLREYTRSPYMLAGLLQSAGYATAGFVGGGFLDPELGFDLGFEVYLSRNDKPQAGPRRGFAGVLPQAEAWYAQRDPARPFFLFLHSYDIHCPYWPAQPWRGRFRGDYDGPLDLRNLCGHEAFEDLFRDGKDLTEEDRAYLLRMYDGGIAMADELLGRFLEQLRADGTLDRALLIILSDHGESLGEHRTVGHNHMWEEQLRVPLMIRFPGGAHGGTHCDAPVMLLDVLPTIQDFLRLPLPPGVQGTSLLPLLAAPQGGERLRISEHLERTSYRFDGRWKVMVTQGADGAIRRALFDLHADPGEERDLAATPAGAQQLRALVERYEKFRQETGADDLRFRGAALEDPIDAELAETLSGLGYTDFQPR